jgi:hypothetical protein
MLEGRVTYPVQASVLPSPVAVHSDDDILGRQVESPNIAVYLEALCRLRRVWGVLESRKQNHPSSLLRGL